MCAIGALAFFLLSRFECTHEDLVFDFTENQNWFDIKLMASPEDNKKAVGNKQYATAIRKLLDELGVRSCHAIHFGRAEGPKMLDCEEVDDNYIKRLGNWSPDTQEKIYSSKMPLPAMRVANGHVLERGCHFNPRTVVEPLDGLCRMIFPFIERAEEKLSRSPNGAEKVTADGFLKLMRSLRKVVLQDAAVMINMGRTHAIFDHHPAFRHPAFLAFKDRMREALNVAPAQDPLNVTLECLMPSVLHHFESLQTAGNEERALMNQKFAHVNQQLDVMSRQMFGLEEQLTANMRLGLTNLERLQSNLVTIPFLQGM